MLMTAASDFIYLDNNAIPPADTPVPRKPESCSSSGRGAISVVVLDQV
jgi:hypothetical protein